jgi:hypothetical protein
LPDHESSLTVFFSPRFGALFRISFHVHPYIDLLRGAASLSLAKKAGKEIQSRKHDSSFYYERAFHELREMPKMSKTTSRKDYKADLVYTCTLFEQIEVSNLFYFQECSMMREFTYRKYYI